MIVALLKGHVASTKNKRYIDMNSILLKLKYNTDSDISFNDCAEISKMTVSKLAGIGQLA